MSFDQERVKEIIGQAMTEFGTAYATGYTKAVVKKIQAETEGVPRPSFPLLESAPSPEFHMQGWVTKQGAVVKNWKKRWFTIDNDYRVSYWMGEKDPHDKDPKTGKMRKKPKGTFTCYGYKCKKSEDSKEYQMNLQPYWDDEYTKRTWHFHFASKEDYDAWNKAFQECIQNSPCPLHKDPLRRAAFEHAYKEMEHTWYFHPTGSEEEMLAYVVMKRCERLVLNDTYNTLPSGAMRAKFVDKIRGAVGALIGPSVATAWKVCQTATDKTEEPLEASVRNVVGPLFQSINAIKDKAQDPFHTKVILPLVKLMNPVANTLIPKVGVPLVKAQKDLIEEFIKHAKDDTRGCWHLYWDLRSREAEYDSVLEVARGISDEWELCNLPSMIMDSCYRLLEDGRFNFVSVDERNLHLSCAKLLHDCLKEQHRVLTWLVELMVMKSFNETLTNVLGELCGPLEELIPDVLKEFLSPSDVIRDMATAAMRSATQACVTTGDQATVPERIAGYFALYGVPIDTRVMIEMARKKQLKMDEANRTNRKSLTAEKKE